MGGLDPGSLAWVDHGMEMSSTRLGAKADVCCQRDSKLGLGPANLTDIWTWIEG